MTAPTAVKVDELREVYGADAFAFTPWLERFARLGVYLPATSADRDRLIAAGAIEQIGPDTYRVAAAHLWP